jgi:hypothetical protein
MPGGNATHHRRQQAPRLWVTLLVYRPAQLDSASGALGLDDVTVLGEVPAL